MAIDEKAMAEQAEAAIFGQRRDAKGRYAGVETEPSSQAERDLDDVIKLATEDTSKRA